MIPYFFFGFFDKKESVSLSSAKASHVFKKRGFSLFKRNSEQTQYVDYVDDAIVEIKPKNQAKQSNPLPTFKYKPVKNGFLSALENSHLKAEAIIQAMVEKSEQAKIKQQQLAIIQAEKARLQDEEDEAILMLMFDFA